MKFSNLIRKHKGSVTVFLTLIMLPSIIFSTAIVDGARISVAKTMASGAGDMAMNAALACYDQALKDTYGLFAMSKNPKELEANFQIYFENTLHGISIDEESDSYTQNFIDSIRKGLSGLGEKTFDNFVDIQTEMFSSKAPEGGNLANPAMLRREILDYMKYRGPINFGMSFFDKLAALKQVSQQSDAVEKKIKYETKLDDTQKKFNTAYDAITKYKEAIKNLTNAKIKQAFIDTEKDFQKINKIMIFGYANKNAVIKDIKPDQANSGLVGNKSTTIENFIKDSLYQSLVNKVNSTSCVSPSASDANIKAADISKRIDYIYAVNEYTERFNLLAGYYKAYTTWYKGLSTEEKTEGVSSDYSEVTSLYNEQKAFAEENNTLAERIFDLFKTEINDTAKVRGQYLKDNILDPLDKAIAESKRAHDALADARKSFSDATTAREAWKDSKDRLVGDAKAPMDADYQSSAAKLDEKELNKLEDALYNENDSAAVTIYKYYTNAKIELEKAKYINTSILTAGTEWFTNFADNCKSAVASAIGSTKDVTALAGIETSFFNANYIGADVDKLGTPPLEITKDNYKFYDYLVKNCKASTANEDNKKKAVATRDNMLKEGDNMQVPNDETSTTSINNMDTLPSVLKDLKGLKQENSSYSKIEMEKVEPFGWGWWGDEKAKNAENSFSTGTSFFKIFSNMAEAAIDKAYIMEYGMNMFSYNTIDKQRGTTKPLMTLSNVPIDSDHNLLYKAEVEYLLWGDTNPTANVNLTIGSIFGIRFVTNSIFALSNANVRAMTLPAATAIAGWTGFGVPIVNTVLQLSMALAESAIDMKTIMGGGKVVLFKTWRTWVTQPGSALEWVKDEGLKAASTAVTEAYSNFKDYTYEKFSEKKDELKGEMEKWLMNVTKGAVDDAISVVVGQLQNILTGIATDDSIENSSSAFDAALTKALEDLKKELNINQVSSEDKASDPVNAIKYEAYEYLIGYKPVLVEEIQALRNEYANPEAIAQTVGDRLRNLINSILTNLSAKGNELINNACDSVWNSVSGQLDNVVEDKIDDVKARVSEKIDGYIAKLGGTQVGSDKNSTTPGSNSAGIGLALGYSDYLRIFLYINLINSEKENMILCRIGDLVQLNMNMPKNGKSDFQMQNAITHIEVNSKVSVKTTLVQFTQGQASKSNLGNRYVINYNGILGY